MEQDDTGSLSARSTSSVEGGSVSSRSKKSKTLARLRKLKKTDGPTTPPPGNNSLHEFSPHPPDCKVAKENGDVEMQRSAHDLVNGLSHIDIDGDNDTSAPWTTTDIQSSDKNINESFKDETSKIIESEKVSANTDTTFKHNSLSMLKDPLNVGDNKLQKLSLFASSLGPLKPTRRGLGGLDPLTPLKPLVLEDSPMKEKKGKSKTKKKSEKKVDMEDGAGEQVRDIYDKEDVLNTASFENDTVTVRTGGMAETETSNAWPLDLLPDNTDSQQSHSNRYTIPSFSRTTGDGNRLGTTLTENVEDALQGAVVSKSTEKLEDEVGDSIDISPDHGGSVHKNAVNLAVSAAHRQERKFSELTNHSQTADTGESGLASTYTDLSQKVEHFDSSDSRVPVSQIKESVSIMDDTKDESDDDLIIASAPSRCDVPHDEAVLPVGTSTISCGSDDSVVVDNLDNSNKLEEGMFKQMLLEQESRLIDTDGLSNDVRHANSDMSAREDDLVTSGRTVIGASDDEDKDSDAVPSDIDEKDLKEYMAKKILEEEYDRSGTASGSNLPRASLLSPITPVNAPPPLPNNFASPVLRTSYKRDDLDDSMATSEVSSLMMSSSSLSETSRSLMSSRLLQHTLTNKSARSGNVSYLSGGVRNTGSLVGKQELDSHLPDRKLKIFVATWNMCENKELPESLEDLLLPDDCELMQDLYVIGSQETCSNISEWEVRLQETLGPTYVLLHSATHGVLHCAVFLRRDLIWFCSPVEESRVTTRPGAKIKTKGAVAVSFNFFGTSLIFIVSHFTSGDEKMKDRLLDYEKILKEIHLPEKVPPTRKFNILTSDVTTRFDCVFWCGDFNFRLAEDKPRVEGWIEQLRIGNKTDFDILVRHDQLLKAKNKNLIFKGFQEGRIKFLPTYKFDIGEDVYDTSTKSRIPSYTDRVLYKCRKASNISLVHYSSCEEIKTSDHRPVYALFEVSIRPGKDGTLTGGGMFSRDVYIEANRRRAEKTGMSKRTQASSAVCSVM